MAGHKNKITQELARKLFRYDEETGILYHRNRDKSMFSNNAQYLNWNGRYPDTQVGSKTKTGYLCTRINKTDYYVHYMIWVYCHGDFSNMEIDHINRNRSDNRISNLRLCSPLQNAHNRSKHRRKDGRKGIYKRNDCNTWRAIITVNGKTVNIGSYKTEQEAIDAYKKASLKAHGEFSIFN